MKTRKNIFTIIMILSIILVFGGCTSVKQQLPNTENDKSLNNEMEIVTEESIKEDEESEYGKILDFDSYDGRPVFAVAFLGYGDVMDTRNIYLEEIFKSLGKPYIEQIEHLEYEGDEWYLVIPRYKNDVLITNIETEDVQTIYKGKTFTIRCNVSDLYSNIAISTEYHMGGHVFSPQVGGDGKLVLSPDVWDITDDIVNK